jgi:isopentenyl-diphosphate delta-isomerase
MNIQEVILVDAEDRELGSMEKMEAHRLGVLHRAFSVFVINDAGQMLLQRRALSKYHSPGLWTNACCSHPSPGENLLDAATRRLQEEMGFQCPLATINSFTYKTHFDNSLTEHEFDHVILGIYNGEVLPDPSEVAEFKWVAIPDLEEDVILNGDQYTFWFHIAYPLIRSRLKV